ncbi:MAG: hypothetical protein QG597_2760 [Actinomycetota bacterium]|nr:hypothetical protein [Actinomycetota bacterium]
MFDVAPSALCRREIFQPVASKLDSLGVLAVLRCNAYGRNRENSGYNWRIRREDLVRTVDIGARLLLPVKVRVQLEQDSSTPRCD